MVGYRIARQTKNPAVANITKGQGLTGFQIQSPKDSWPKRDGGADEVCIANGDPAAGDQHVAVLAGLRQRFFNRVRIIRQSVQRDQFDGQLPQQTGHGKTVGIVDLSQCQRLRWCTVLQLVAARKCPLGRR